MAPERALDGSAQLCTFVLDGLLLGIDVIRVQEVIRCQPMTRVPLASAAVGGLINLRGQIVTAIDLRWQLGLPPRRADQPPMNVVVRTDEGAVSLLVDEIDDIIDVPESSFEEPPANISPRSRELIRGVYKLEHRLLLLVDAERATRIGRHTRATGEPDR